MHIVRHRGEGSYFLPPLLKRWRHPILEPTLVDPSSTPTKSPTLNEYVQNPFFAPYRWEGYNNLSYS
jgi:hypothetical protein